MPGYDKIVAHSFGGPEVLQLEHSASLPKPAHGEVRVRVSAAGVGYTDTILRRGRYIAYTGGLPLTPGYDVAGIVDKLGAGAHGVAVGDTVVDMPVHGAYSQFIVRPAASLIRIPAAVDPAAAVEVPLMWTTAWQMLTRIVQLAPHAAILVVGASGSVGRALVMLGRHLEMRVIGTCSAANLPLVGSLGGEALDYRRPDLLAAIRSGTGGAGVAAAFDNSWETSWRALAASGTLVGYGFQNFLDSNAPPAEAARAMLQFNQAWNEEGRSDGSHRSTTFYDIGVRRQSQPGDYRSDVEHLLGLIATGSVVPPAPELLPLDQAAEAHRRIPRGGLQQRIVLRP